MKPLKDLCRWDVFDDGEGTYYVVVNPDHLNYPIINLNGKPYYHHWNEFPEYVRVIGMMFLEPDYNKD